MTSKNELNRQKGLHQVDQQREAILKAAEHLFLRQGLENTTMGEIANEAKIHRATLYRYFPNIDPISFEIAVRMLQRIKTSTDISEEPVYLQAVKEDILAMIDQFSHLRNAYRFLGMFDHLYGDRYPSQDLASWFKDEVNAMRWGKGRFSQTIPPKLRAQLVVLLNTIMSFLEKMASRGELMANEQDVPLENQLEIFRAMVDHYLVDLINKNRQTPAAN